MKLHIKNVPNTLDDCSKKQIIQILKIASDTNITPLIKRIKLFYILINNQGNFFEKLNYWYQFKFKIWWIRTKLGNFIHTHEGLNIDIYLPECDWKEFSYEAEEVTDFLYSEDEILLKQKIKRIGFWLIGPSDYFGNLTFKQFREADAEFHEMLFQKLETGEIIVTDGFIRALYTNISPFGQLPIELNEIERKIILMYYIGNRKQLSLEFEHVFKVSTSNSQNEQSNSDYVRMWENILNSVAEKPQFYSITDNLNVRSVLLNLDQKFAKDEAMKTAYEQSAIH